MRRFFSFLGLMTISACSICEASPRLLVRTPTIHKIEGSQPGIRVKINGKPALLSVDTGSGYTILIPQYVASLKIKLGRPFEETDGYGDVVTGYELPPLDFSIGGWTEKQSNLVTEDMPPFNLAEPGILSPNHLRNVGLYILNFPAKEMLLFDQAPKELLPWATTWFPSISFEIIELFTTLGESDKEGGVTYTKASLNELAPMPMLIDSGARTSYFSDAYLTDRPSRSEHSGPSGAGKTIDEEIVQNQTLRIGSHPFKMAQTAVHPKATMKGLAGVIGMDVLKDLILIVDYPGKRMLLGFLKTRVPDSKKAAPTQHQGSAR